MSKTNYTEPKDFIPEEIRKKHKLGEYYEEEPEKKENRDLNKEFRDYVNDKK